MELYWTKSSWDEISKLQPIAKSTNNNISYSKNTIWFGLFDKEIVGSAGLLLLNNGEGRLKSMYISKEYRGQGYGIKAVELRESWAFDTLSLSKLSLITRRKDFWLNREYKIDTESGQPKGKYLMYKYSPLRKETNE
tara:strand:- start:5 stop:415 length:411 start_codon:yes stop_codon:yes gene_type:complete